MPRRERRNRRSLNLSESTEPRINAVVAYIVCVYVCMYVHTRNQRRVLRVALIHTMTLLLLQCSVTKARHFNSARHCRRATSIRSGAGQKVPMPRRSRRKNRSLYPRSHRAYTYSSFALSSTDWNSTHTHTRTTEKKKKKRKKGPGLSIKLNDASPNHKCQLPAALARVCSVEL